MFRRANLFLGVVLCLFGATAHAQQNPLSALLGAAKTDADTAGANGPMVKLLKTYAAANTTSNNAFQACRSLSFGVGLKKYEADFKLGNYLSANAGYLIIAENYALCAVGQGQPVPTSRPSLSQAFDLVGANLAMSVVAASKAGLETPEAQTNARNALTLLSPNSEANKDLIDAVKATGLAGTVASAAPAKGAKRAHH